ncbi:hypothetical protein Hanom_Chr13g01185331 [Helianthus anomalus]
MRPWTDSYTWEESVCQLEESMNEELTRVLSMLKSPSLTHPMWRSPSTDA